MKNYPSPSTSFVAIDVEYCDDEHNICQFGLSVVRDCQITEQRCWNIQPPGNHYDAKYYSHNHLRPEDTVNSPSFSNVWTEIEPYLRDKEIWAHNATSAEQSILEKNLRLNGIVSGTYNVYDSIRLYIRPDKKQWNEGNGLRACLYAVGLPCENHHDAGADASMCAQIIIAHLQGVEPDWDLADRKMEDYMKNKPELKSSFFFNSFNKEQDGTDSVNVRNLNTSVTNPIYGANVVLTGFFHISRKQLREALKAMGAILKSGVTKNVQVVLVGEKNVGPNKIRDLETLIHNGYNIARIEGDVNLDRLLYDKTLTPEDFSVPAVANKNLNFTINHFRKHHHKFVFPKNSIATKELFVPQTGFMGELPALRQMFGNLGAYANHDYFPQINIVVLPNSSIEALQRGEKDGVIREFENYYNSQNSVTFNADFITERDFLKFVRERIVYNGDMATGKLYIRYLHSAGIDSEKDFKYGLEVVRRSKLESRIDS